MSSAFGKNLAWLIYVCVMLVKPLGTPAVRGHFPRDGSGYGDVVEALRREIPPSCLHVALKQEGNVFIPSEPHLVLDLDLLTDTEWKVLGSSPTFASGCVTLYALRVPRRSLYEKVVSLRRSGAAFYHLIGSETEKETLELLLDPDFEKEENVAVISQKNSQSWIVRTRRLYSPRGFRKVILSNVWTPSRGFIKDRRMFPEQMKNFYGASFSGSTLEFLPLTHYETTPGSRTLRAKPSLEIFMLDVISKHLNFTYELRAPEDGQWGIELPDVSVSMLLVIVESSLLD